MECEYLSICRKQMSKSLLFLGATVLILVFQPFSVNASDEHACQYLSVEEVSSVMGFKVNPPERKPANVMGESICFFDVPDEQGFKFVQLSLVTSSSEKLKKLGFTASSFFQNNMGFLENLKKVDGIGEEAFWGGSGMKMGAGLHIYYKDVSFTILSKSTSEDNSLSKSKKLAEIVISKIR